MYRSRSELMPVFDLKFSNHANDIITSVSYSDEHLVFFDSFTKQKRKESFQPFLNGVRIIVFQSLNCAGIYCHLPLSFKRTIITFLFDNYCAMETVN